MTNDSVSAESTMTLPPTGETSEQSHQPSADRQPLRDRVWNVKSMVAVAAATVIVGGMAGFGLGQLAGGSTEIGAGRGGFNRMPGQVGQPPGQQQPQVPPGSRQLPDGGNGSAPSSPDGSAPNQPAPNRSGTGSSDRIT